MYIITKIVIFIIHFYSFYSVCSGCQMDEKVLLNCLLLLVLFVNLNTPSAL